MISFEYTLKDPMGLHARPAGQIVKEAKNYKSKITFIFGENQAEAIRMMAIMRLGTKAGDTVKVTVDGEDEQTAATLFEKFLKETV